MVSTKTKKKTIETKPRDPYKNFRVLTFFAGLLFFVVGMRSLTLGDSAGALLNGLAGVFFLMASYIFFKKKGQIKNKGN
ncbi:MAG: hypothetical protein APG12_01229 [Candidatus Methanofastidiosum methylothiophilum]|uniref:Uncharacterized protein n=1 Tax=Candidatus Methanofastidiosum methylothiophilum TaxID=1705564 RepID=A0A150IIU3_9EURY|nr:MAG: hypothetical protein APG10_01296 [Candidatus Methanofastidiosum methylthiophilus]KYC47802.1 MAG: hypothetical protein APG11_00880 [Candidatus Methanofastidiosum methylthiophilus]KYC49830.1 MAG: hypothetical protein APG12_01229 [Candidatus Methanofastidiosum methylthiophilus]